MLRMPEGYYGLGTCCACGSAFKVRNVLPLAFLAPEPGTGWSCAECQLDRHGAYAIVCDKCFDSGARPLQIVSGPIGSWGREILSCEIPYFYHTLPEHESYNLVMVERCIGSVDSLWKSWMDLLARDE